MDHIEIGGRRWEIRQPTVRQRLWQQKYVRLAGLDKVQPQKGEKAEDFAVRLLHELRSSPNVLLLLAGFIVPDGAAKWTEQQAEETASFLGDLDSDADMQEIDKLLLFVFTGFLESRLHSQELSRTALKAEAEAQPAKRPEPHETVLVPPY